MLPRNISLEVPQIPGRCAPAGTGPSLERKSSDCTFNSRHSCQGSALKALRAGHALMWFATSVIDDQFSFHRPVGLDRCILAVLPSSFSVLPQAVSPQIPLLSTYSRLSSLRPSKPCRSEFPRRCSRSEFALYSETLRRTNYGHLYKCGR